MGYLGTCFWGAFYRCHAQFRPCGCSYGQADPVPSLDGSWKGLTVMVLVAVIYGDLLCARPRVVPFTPSNNIMM